MVALADSKTPNTLLAAMRHFTPDVAREYIAGIKWSDGVRPCPKCGSVNTAPLKSRGLNQCREKGCRKQFSLTVGTIFEGTHLRLDQWIAGIWLIANCRNGVSSCEIARTIGCKQQSAWHLLHRVRHVLAQEYTDKMGERFGSVEADLTYIGGLISNMSPGRIKRAMAHGRPYGNKMAVHAIRDRRSGNIRASALVHGAACPSKAEVWKHVARGARVYTDAAKAYRNIGSVYRHEYVNHTAGEYVRGVVHTNGCENFFNCLRRMVKGTYIKPTADHLAAYVDEAVFRFNVRKLTEWERFDTAMRLIVGKRLTYSELTDGAKR